MQYMSEEKKADTLKSAKYTIISGCPNTELYSLDQSNLPYIPNTLQVRYIMSIILLIQ